MDNSKKQGDESNDADTFLFWRFSGSEKIEKTPRNKNKSSVGEKDKKKKKKEKKKKNKKKKNTTPKKALFKMNYLFANIRINAIPRTTLCE